jgi:hypothetical protein
MMNPSKTFNNSMGEVGVDTLGQMAKIKMKSGKGLFTNFGAGRLIDDYNNFLGQAPLANITSQNWKTG